MSIAANVVICLVLLLHLYFLALEMFLWERPIATKAFGFTPEFAKNTRALAANQGLYNGFLAAGLAWGLFLGPSDHGIRAFFLVCVIIAGVFGAITANRRILFIQALPAAIALALVFLS